MPEEIVMNVWLFVFSFSCMFYSIINMRYLRTFWEHRKMQYISQRRPIMLVVYCALASIYLFVMIPCMSLSIFFLRFRDDFSDSAQRGLDAFYFLIDSIYGTVFPTFINIIAIRVWLLYYDHKFAMATVDRIWRKSINPGEKNFFLRHKATVGDHVFLFRCVFAFWVVKITILMTMILVFIRPFDDRTTKIDELVYYTFRIGIIVPTLVFILWIYKKVHHIHDEFNIKNEMRYLAFFVAFLIFSSLVTLVVILFTDLPIYRFELFVYANDAFFYCGTCYIQTRWVLKQYLSKRDDISKQRKRHSTRALSFSMVDVLRRKHSFEAFVRHCMSELSVESLLFLVEVAQYKATLTSYRVPDPATQFLSLNVQTINTRQVLLDVASGQLTASTETQQTQQQPKPTPTSQPAANSEIDRLNLGAFLSDIEVEETPSTVSSGPAAAPPAPVVVENTDIGRKYGAMYQFQQFQASILDRKWLPIASTLQLRQRQSNSMVEALLTDKSSESVKSTNSNEAESPPPAKSLQSVMVNAIANNQPSPMLQVVMDGKEVEMNKVAPMAPTATTIATGDGAEQKESRRESGSPVGTVDRLRVRNTLGMTAMATSSLSGPGQVSPADGRSLVSPRWIREYAWFLYEKYVKDDSDLAINVSGEARSFLADFFGLEEEEVLTYIVEHSGGEQDESKELPAGVDEHVLLNTYLYHLFDQAFEEIWALLQSDSFIRFTMTDAYDKLGEIWDTEQQEEPIQIVYEEQP